MRTCLGLGLLCAATAACHIETRYEDDDGALDAARAPDAGHHHPVDAAEADAPHHADAAATPDAAPPPDAAVPRCGDGVRSLREVCETLVVIDLPDGVSDARLVDLDQDGALDLAYLTSGHLAFRRGDGHGAFAAETTGPATDGYLLAAGDVDHDGIVDLATVLRNELSVWRGLGGGTFALAASATDYGSIADVAIANTDGFPGDEIGVVSEWGLSQFQYTGASTLYRFDTTGSVLTTLAFTDVDHDGEPDALGTQNDVGRVYFSTPTGAGTSTSAYGVDASGKASYTAHVEDTAAGDLDGDGEDEIVLAQSDPPGVSTTSTAHGSHITDPGVLSPVSYVDIVDLDRDGNVDVIAATITPPTATVVFGQVGNQVGSLLVGPVFALPAAVTALHVDGDANGDGIPDPVITVTGHVAILMSEAP